MALVQGGYMISWLFLFLKVPWMSAIWFVIVDLVLVMYMRDCVILFFNLFIKNESIKNWQVDGVKIAKRRQQNNMSIICPFNAFLKVTNEIEEKTDEINPLNTQNV